MRKYLGNKLFCWPQHDPPFANRPKNEPRIRDCRSPHQHTRSTTQRGAFERDTYLCPTQYRVTVNGELNMSSLKSAFERRVENAREVGVVNQRRGHSLVR